MSRTPDEWIDLAHGDIHAAASEATASLLESVPTEISEYLGHRTLAHATTEQELELVELAFRWQFCELLALKLRHTAEGWCEAFYRALKRHTEENPSKCPHCGGSSALTQQPNGEWMCLDCYWQEGEDQ